MVQFEPIRPARAPAAAPATPLDGSPWEAAARAACAHAPYLRRLIEQRPDLLERADGNWPARLVGEALEAARAIAAAPPALEEGMRALRRAKDAVHLGLALADLARAWDLEAVTGGLTAFADEALRAGLALAARDMIARGEFRDDALDPARGPAPGVALIAMGKMGAHELNYSSDIDVSVFYDPDLLPLAVGKEARVAAVRLVAPLVRALEERTADGYVFRTDLRLRPDPGSTPPAVSIVAAEHYYQSVGQNWERAAFIKARAAAGDMETGRAFLDELQSFIWRKHLDFAAVADVQSIKRQILSVHKSAQLGEPVFDVKLGRGGIRDIELFAQTQQLILGGRNKTLRDRTTRGALAALREADAISPAAHDALIEAYGFFRDVEHRIQMMEDAHSHRVPADPEARARLAALCGFEDVGAFEAALVARRGIVSEIDHELFGRGESLADPLGSLVFTGVDDDEDTLETIAKLGYRQPAQVSQTIRGWHHGRIRAMRAERARELLTALTPRLLRALAETGEPDQAFARFATFFAGLSAGVQLLSLLAAKPALLDTLARLFGLSPRLAQALSRRPALIDAMIEARFITPLAEDEPNARRAELHERLAETSTFEAALNAARRFQREEAFRIGVQVLDGAASAAAAGAAHADLAEACVAELALSALAEVERRAGAAPGAFTVLALGKFGGRELAEASDLDVMVVYDAPEGARSGEGLSPAEFYTRFTQRFISALSAQTEEGALYEIDMQLRPSGSAGPVAVRRSSFERYYEVDAWTWELQALTRMRPVAGDAALGARALEIARARLTKPCDTQKLFADVADMRARMARERPAKTHWDLKLAAGGLVDVEFIAQALQIAAAPRAPQVLSSNTGEALARLAETGALSAHESEMLIAAWTLYSDLQQGLRICVENAFEPEHATAMLKARLAALGRAESFEALEQKLIAAQAEVRAAFVRLVGVVQT